MPAIKALFSLLIRPQNSLDWDIHKRFCWYLIHCCRQLNNHAAEAMYCDLIKCYKCYDHLSYQNTKMEVSSKWHKTIYDLPNPKTVTRHKTKVVLKPFGTLTSRNSPLTGGRQSYSRFGPDSSFFSQRRGGPESSRSRDQTYNVRGLSFVMFFMFSILTL